MSEEINKIIQTARLNFVDNKFNNWLNVNKYFNLLKNADLPFNEDVYCVYAAIINSLLLNYLDDFTQKNFLNTKKIASLILQLDNIILKSTQIIIEEKEQNNLNFKLLDNLIKCIFYMRIGDFIFATIFAEKSSLKKSSKQLILAIYSYNIALEYLIKGFKINIEKEENNSNLFSILSFCALELNILIKKNENLIDENALFFCNNSMLGSFIHNFAEIFNNNKEEEENNKFIFSDQTTITKTKYFDIKKYLKNSFLLIENNYFLRRLVWIICEISDDFIEEIYNFIDDFFNYLPDCPQDEFNSCSPESISKFDLKIFLFRLSNYLNCQFNKNQIDCTPPFIFYKKPNLSHLKFWNFIIKCEGTSNQLININNIIEITTIIEQIRDPPKIEETNNCSNDDLINTIKFIKNQLKTTKNEKLKNYLKIILERYLNLFKLINILPPENDWIFIFDDEENKIEIKENKEINEEQNKEQNKEEKEEIIIIEEEEDKKKEKEHLTISTQTDKIIEQTNIKQNKIVQDWGETNFYLNRWIYHNEALYKMFNKK